MLAFIILAADQDTFNTGRQIQEGRVEAIPWYSGPQLKEPEIYDSIFNMLNILVETGEVSLARGASEFKMRPIS